MILMTFFFDTFPSVPVIVSGVEAITVVDDLLTKCSSSSLILGLSIPIVTVMVFVYFRGLQLLNFLQGCTAGVWVMK